MSTAPSPPPSRPALPRGYRPHLDGVRALAVVAVILFHLGYGWIPAGFVGVDVFFVLSGYLITGLLVTEAVERGGVDLARFYARRARRLLPAAALVLVTVMVATAWLLDPVGQQSVGQDATWSALYSANWRFVAGGTDYFTEGDVPSPLVHFWSLAVEEQFYLVWPLAFAALWRLSTRRRGPEATGGALAAVVALGAVSAVLSVVLVPSTAAYYGTHTRAYQLLAGAALALAGRRWAARIPTGPGAGRAGGALVAVSVAALVVLATGGAASASYPGVDGLWVTAASLSLIGGLDLLPPGVAQRLLGARLPAAVGRLSYSLYVWHWPVIVFFPVLARRWSQPALTEMWVQVVAFTACAGASYVLVERPVRFGLARRASQRAVIASGLVLSLTVAVVGIPFLQPRDPFQVRALAAVTDLAPSGPCPYFFEEWGPPSQSEPCVYRRGGPYTVALVGDSHAQQWQPAVEELAERYDMTVVRVTRRGCPTNDLTVQSFDDQGITRTDVPCTIWRERVMEDLVARYDPELIFVENRSHEWAFEHGDRTVERDDPDHLELWAEAWDPSLEVLTAGTGQVVVSETLPNMPFRVPACLAEHGEGTTRCDVPVSADAGVEPYNAAIRDLAGRHDVMVVDPTPIVCPGEVCPALVDGVIVHRDDDHVSASFARHAAPAFEAMLVAAGVTLSR